ncbi:MAG: hypothetical protein NC092_08340 [Butyrivibrio sp.]|nr:hypothetical protein [Muribaculum sp.]MCM1552685.1 hypothetical protein [Butyrivibrio sp.]
MGDSRIETTTGLCVVALTKHLMKRHNMDYEAAYKMLLRMELYKLLSDAETRLFFETNEYLCEACDNELEGGEDALYEYINC